MKNNEPLRIVVAETSLIIRSGVVSLLRHLPGVNIHPIEAVSMEALQECIRTQRTDILIVSPTFGGWFNPVAIKTPPATPNLKCIALLCSVVESALLKEYDETISIYETTETMLEKLNRLQHIPLEEEEPPAEVGSLSQREKEIIVCVVKGMTNKAIAEKLFLSIHTIITHRRNIARKLQIHSPAGLTIYAIVNKLVELQDIESKL